MTIGEQIKLILYDKECELHRFCSNCKLYVRQQCVIHRLRDVKSSLEFIQILQEDID